MRRVFWIGTSQLDKCEPVNVHISVQIVTLVIGHSTDKRFFFPGLGSGEWARWDLQCAA